MASGCPDGLAHESIAMLIEPLLTALGLTSGRLTETEPRRTEPTLNAILYEVAWVAN